MELVPCGSCGWQTQKRFVIKLTGETVCPVCAWNWAAKSSRFVLVEECTTGSGVRADVKVKKFLGFKFKPVKVLVLETSGVEIKL